MCLDQPKEIKIFLAKSQFVYYSFQRKEFGISYRFLRTLLVISIFSIAFQTSVSAKDIKQKSLEEYRIKGYEAQQKGNLNDALTSYLKASSLDPNSPALFNDIGVVYEKLGMLDRAETSYLQALQVNDHYLPAYLNLAYLYETQGDLTRAAEYFKKRIEWGDPDDPWTQRAKESLYALGEKAPELKEWIREQEVSDLTEELIREAKEDFAQRIIRSQEFYRAGQKLAKKGSYSLAIEEYNRALAFTPNNPKILQAREEAILEVTKQRVKEHVDSAMKMLNLGDTVSAKIEFRKILSIIPNEPIPVSK